MLSLGSKLTYIPRHKMECSTPRATKLSLDERMERCSVVRDPLGEVLGKPYFTYAITGEAIPDICEKTTLGIRERLANLHRCSITDVVFLKSGEILSNDDHIYDDCISVVIKSSFNETQFSSLVTAPSPPSNLLGHSTRISFAGEPINYIQDIFQRLQHTDAEIHVNLEKWQISIDYFNCLFHHCRALALVYNNSIDIVRSTGDGVAFLHLLKHIRCDELSLAPLAPLLWTEKDVSDIVEGLSEAPGEALSLILRYKMFPDLVLQDLQDFALERLSEHVEVSFLAARVLSELGQRGKLSARIVPQLSHALLGARPLVARELLVALGAITRGRA